MKWLCCLIVAGSFAQAATQPTGFPFGDEKLSYAIKWPSGLSLGEAKLSATRSGSDWMFDLTLDAAVPGYVVKDGYHSVADSNLCASEFDRETLHGTKKAKETTAIASGKAIRKTAGGGGQTDIPVASCAHDALTALFASRREFGQGRVPKTEKIVFGGSYELQMQYTGAQVISVADVPAQADRVFCTVTVRENQKYEFEVFFARDAARTPLLIRVPFPLGAMSMELVR